MQQVGHLQKLHEKYFQKGLRIIAISKEAPGLIESKVVEERNATYWMASDPSGSTFARFSSGRIGIPHAYLVDASGTVVGEGVPSEQQIESLLEGAFDASLGRELHKALKPAVKLYEKGQIGKAWAAAARPAANEDREISSDAKFLRERAEAYAAFRKKLVEDGINAKDFATVYDDLKSIPKEFAGMEVVAWASETRKRLDGDDAVQTERKAWDAYLKAAAKEEKAGGKAKKLGPARTAYKRVVKKYPDTRGAKMAEEALGRLGQG